MTTNTVVTTKRKHVAGVTKVTHHAALLAWWRYCDEIDAALPWAAPEDVTLFVDGLWYDAIASKPTHHDVVWSADQLRKVCDSSTIARSFGLHNAEVTRS
jgi:hypothetical protein